MIAAAARRVLASLRASACSYGPEYWIAAAEGAAIAANAALGEGLGLTIAAATAIGNLAGRAAYLEVCGGR